MEWTWLSRASEPSWTPTGWTRGVARSAVDRSTTKEVRGSSAGVSRSLPGNTALISSASSNRFVCRNEKFNYSLLTIYSAETIVEPCRIVRSWYAGRWWVGGLLHLVQRGGDWAGPHRRPVYQSPYYCIMVRCRAVLMWHYSTMRVRVKYSVCSLQCRSKVATPLIMYWIFFLRLSL